MTTTMPSSIGPFHVEAFLGRGAFSAVYRVRSIANSSLWAMKVAKSCDPAKKGKKESEEQTSNRCLQWENTVYNGFAKDSDFIPKRPLTSNERYGESLGWKYLTLELIEGGSLVENMQRGRPTMEACFSVVIRVMNALKVLHVKGMLHRDLKPENVVLVLKQDDCDERGAVLIDFGACMKFLNVGGGQCEGGAPVGTAAYMSLGVHRLQQPAPRDDLQSLGYLLMWLLNGGSLPWSEAESDEQVIKAKADPKIVAELYKIHPVLKKYFKMVDELKGPAMPDYARIELLLMEAGGEPRGTITWTDGAAAEKVTKASSKKPKKQVVIEEEDDEVQIVEAPPPRQAKPTRRASKAPEPPVELAVVETVEKKMPKPSLSSLPEEVAIPTPMKNTSNRKSASPSREAPMIRKSARLEEKLTEAADGRRMGRLAVGAVLAASVLAHSYMNTN